MRKLQIVKRPPRLISDGLCVTHDAYIVIDKRVPSEMMYRVALLVQEGLIRVETARLKPQKATP